MRADICICLVCPLHRGSNGIIQIEPVCPELALCRKFAGLDLGGKISCPVVCSDVGLPADAAQQLFGDAGIPDVMQIQLGIVPPDENTVPSSSNVLRVERLMKVANEVNHELGGLIPPPRIQIVIQQLICVVLDGAYHAPVLLAIPVKIHATVRRWAVFCIDEMEVLREATPPRVADTVCPGCNAS